ncbi:MAG: hypothetical protein HQM10_19350 [Candidatus Riflebacteria bacterium]|nr:hypothetical protein [Candidatus Riflebacteria bacterium]
MAEYNELKITVDELQATKTRLSAENAEQELIAGAVESRNSWIRRKNNSISEKLSKIEDRIPADIKIESLLFVKDSGKIKFMAGDKNSSGGWLHGCIGKNTGHLTVEKASEGKSSVVFSWTE